jgi:hypothetical protein
MSRGNTRALACSQPDAAQILADFQQLPAIELRVRKLCQRFSLAPEVARTVAGLAFAVDARA